MAHLVETMMSVKQTPWHGLGTILDHVPTAEEAIKAAGLDWTVSKRKMHYMTETSTLLETSDRYAIVRDTDNRYLGHSGKTWQPLQNSDAFKFFDPFVNANEATYETAGSLESGKRVWVLAKINRDPIEVVPGDLVDKYILLSNRHDCGVSVIGALTPIRVVCNNTLSFAMRNKKTQLFRATHSSKLEEGLQRIQATIAAADQAFKQAGEHYKQFALTQVKQKTFDSYLAEVFDWQEGVNKGREEAFKNKMTLTIQRLFETGRGTEIRAARGTLWGLYNAVTEYIAHENKKDPEDRLRQAWFGNGMNLNVKAYETAMRYAS